MKTHWRCKACVGRHFDCHSCTSCTFSGHWTWHVKNHVIFWGVKDVVNGTPICEHLVNTTCTFQFISKARLRPLQLPKGVRPKALDQRHEHHFGMFGFAASNDVRCKASSDATHARHASDLRATEGAADTDPTDTDTKALVSTPTRHMDACPIGILRDAEESRCFSPRQGLQTVL